MEKMLQHPLMEEVGKVLRESADGTLSVEPNTLESVRRKALHIESGEEMFRLVLQLTTFATFLKRRKSSPQAAEALFALADPLACRLGELALCERRQDDERQSQAQHRSEAERHALQNNAVGMAGLQPSKTPGASIRAGGTSKWPL
ncbi:MAG: hypothetical protein R3C68_04525 [Myxococcota bacterium]